MQREQQRALFVTMLPVVPNNDLILEMREIKSQKVLWGNNSLWHTLKKRISNQSMFSAWLLIYSVLPTIRGEKNLKNSTGSKKDH